MLSYLLVAFFAVALTLALKRAIKSKVTLVALTAVAAAIAFQTIVYLDLKYLDPFVLIAFVYSALLAGGVSVLTLLAVNRIEARKGQSPQRHS